MHVGGKIDSALQAGLDLEDSEKAAPGGSGKHET